MRIGREDAAQARYRNVELIDPWRVVGGMGGSKGRQIGCKPPVSAAVDDPWEVCVFRPIFRIRKADIIFPDLPCCLAFLRRDMPEGPIVNLFAVGLVRCSLQV